jgi:hypothetical protein
MKLGGSLGNVPQKMKNLMLYNIKCTLENVLRVRNISSFYNKLFQFLWYVTLRDPPDFINLLLICSIKYHHQHPFHKSFALTISNLILDT